MPWQPRERADGSWKDGTSFLVVIASAVKVNASGCHVRAVWIGLHAPVGGGINVNCAVSSELVQVEIVQMEKLTCTSCGSVHIEPPPAERKFQRDGARHQERERAYEYAQIVAAEEAEQAEEEPDQPDRGATLNTTNKTEEDIQGVVVDRGAICNPVNPHWS